MHTPATVRKPARDYGSAILQVSKGCSYGKCLFCNLFTTEPFETVPMEHILEDLDELALEERQPSRMLLIGGNPLGLPNSWLVPVLRAITEKLPAIREVNGYMRIGDIARKSDEELREMASIVGLEANIGTEYGWDPALARMNKGQTTADIVEQLARLDEAGIAYSVFYLPGFAGKGKCEQGARESAKVFSRIHPKRITLLTLTPYPGSPLRDEIEAGTFELAPESESMRDAALFLENLECEGDIIISGSHDANLFKIDGLLPRDREGMVATLRMRADQVNDKAMGALRMRMKAM